jgi:hypothetical protein
MATSHVDSYQRSQDTRRRVLAMAPSLRSDRSGGAVDQYLALLQDRLPSWLRTLHDLSHLVGKGKVSDNLLLITQAGIEYYLELQSASLPAFTSASATVRFREAVRASGLGPMAEIAPLAAYLQAEQRIGRVAAAVEPVAAARLLLAGCFRQAHDEMFAGTDVGPTRDDWAASIVRELRLAPG